MVYEREPCARSFREDLEAHLLHGHVFSTPEYFCMGRAVRRDADAADIVNPWVSFPMAECDAWMVYLVAGDMRAAWSCFPKLLPWVGFERSNRLRWVSFARLAGRMDISTPQQHR